MNHEHHIAFKESFHLREPVLEKILPSERWQDTPDGERIAFELPLNCYSAHERHIIEFTLNPYITAENIFSGLSQPTAQTLANSLNELFGPSGFYTK